VMHGEKLILPQRRKGAKKTFRNAAALCVFAPLREKSSCFKLTELQPD
jgi:hypothetical protein